MCLYLSGCAAPEEKGARDKIGGVETGGDEGDNVFENGRRADVD